MFDPSMVRGGTLFSHAARGRVRVLTVVLALAFLFGCKEKAAPVVAVPEVLVLNVASKSTPLSQDLVSEIRAFREVELRARVSGAVLRQNFRPGQRVKEGDLLFVIDPRPYDQSVATAQANLAEAQATLSRAEQDVARYEPLLADNAIPRQTYDLAVAQTKQYRAIVDARRATLEQARTERSYCEIRSPISGQIGLQKVEVGTLVTQGQTSLATVSTLDPVFAYFNIPEVVYLAMADRFKQDSDGSKARPIELILADGSKYSSTGQIDFADRALNAATGTLALRAQFPNPDNLLRPGMNTRVRIVYDVAENAILVPQKAVSEMLGRYFVTVVAADNKVEQRAIKPGQRVGDLWLIESGLAVGERIVVEGLQQARPGVVVNPRPYASADASSEPK